MSAPALALLGLAVAGSGRPVGGRAARGPLRCSAEPAAARARSVGAAMPCQERGWSGSSGTDPGPITPNDVTSAGTTTFRPQALSTRARFPAMAMRW